MGRLKVSQSSNNLFLKEKKLQMMDRAISTSESLYLVTSQSETILAITAFNPVRSSIEIHLCSLILIRCPESCLIFNKMTVFSIRGETEFKVSRLKSQVGPNINLLYLIINIINLSSLAFRVQVNYLKTLFPTPWLKAQRVQKPSM